MKAVVEFAGQFFRKTITQLTHQDFSYLDGGIISVCTLLNYSAHYIKNDVQQSTERSNPEAQPSTPGLPTIHVFHIKLDGIDYLMLPKQITEDLVGR